MEKIEVTSTPTPQKILDLADQWTAVDGRLMKRTQSGWEQLDSLPEGVERVDKVELHTSVVTGETAVYGIEIQNGVDEMAVAKFNGREWEKYEGLIRVAYVSKENWPVGFENQIKEKYDTSEVKRLIDLEGKNIPFGIIEITPYKREDGTDISFVKLSGYPVGIFTFDTPEGPFPYHFLIFRVPLKDGEQDITVMIASYNDKYGRWRYPVGLVPDSRIFDEQTIKDYQIWGDDLVKILEKPEALKNQMILQTRFPVYDKKFKEENERCLRLFESIKSGESIEIETGTDIAGIGNQVYIDKALAKP